MDSAMKPSILHARSGIGSSEELDEYGVWVKSEPKDWTENDDGFKIDAFDESSAGFDSLNKHEPEPNPVNTAVQHDVSLQTEAQPENLERQTELLQTIADELFAIK
jgi:hypothetical protein